MSVSWFSIRVNELRSGGMSDEFIARQIADDIYRQTGVSVQAAQFEIEEQIKSIEAVDSWSIEDAKAWLNLPVKHGTKSSSKTRCPGCGAELNLDGSCPEDPDNNPIK